jgi:SNF2 family DNA or RNA helicase
MTSAARQDAIRRFSDDENTAVFLVSLMHAFSPRGDYSHVSIVAQVSLKAGGTGLNLVMASRVFLMDPWFISLSASSPSPLHMHTLTYTRTHRWNPAIEQQCIDRVHRMGQTRPVEVVRLLVRDTAEQEIARLQERKRRVAASVLDKKALASTTKLSQQELAQCFGMRSY